MTQPGKEAGGPSGGGGGSDGGGGEGKPYPNRAEQTRAVLAELNRQGITNLDDLMRQVIANTPNDALEQAPQIILCRFGKKPPGGRSGRYCLIVKDA